MVLNKAKTLAITQGGVESFKVSSALDVFSWF